VANVVFNHPPLFFIELKGQFHVAEFLLFALEGLACGLLAVVFMKLLKTAGNFANQLSIPAACKPMLAGFVLGVIALQIPEVLGAGQEILHTASVPGSFSAGDLATVLLTKIFVTILCIGFGFAGGVIFPALLVGVLFGALFAISVPELLLDEYSGLSVYAICGMVAVASPVIGAPMTALLIIFELTRSYEITIAAMVTVVFSNLVAYHWYGRSLFDTQLAERGLDLSLGRDRAYLKHQQVIDHMTQVLPCCDSSTSCEELNDQFKSTALKTAVVIDADEKFLGLVHLDQLGECTPEANLVSLVSSEGLVFDETTSLWSAMQAMRDYIGEAIPVVDSVSGRYLGAMSENELIGNYLDAVLDLRREEHEA
jgi:CIC family chloride channel protein